LAARAAEIEEEAHARSALRMSQLLSGWREIARESAAVRRATALCDGADAFARASALVRGFAAFAEAVKGRRLAVRALREWRDVAHAPGSVLVVRQKLAQSGLVSLTDARRRLALRSALLRWRIALRCASLLADRHRRRTLLRSAFQAWAKATRSAIRARLVAALAERQALRWSRDVAFEAWRALVARQGRGAVASAEATVRRAKKAFRAWKEVAAAAAAARKRSSGAAVRGSSGLGEEATTAMLAALRARLGDTALGRLVAAPPAAVAAAVREVGVRRPWLPTGRPSGPVLGAGPAPGAVYM